MQQCTFNNSIAKKYADNNGDFYCRAVHGVLNIKLDQAVCGIGCPYYKGESCAFYDGNVKCNTEKAMKVYDYMEQEIASGHLPLFPAIKENDKLIALQKAFDYAANAHKGLLRKGTKIPYFTHLITTLNYAMMLTDDTEILMASVLHDTVEDTWVTVDDIRREFGDRIAHFVASETENKRADKPANETWEIRKQENVNHLKEASYEVKLLVLSDKTANTESMLREWRICGDELWKKFNQHDKSKHAWYYYSCAEVLEEFSDTDVMKIYLSYLKELFGER